MQLRTRAALECDPTIRTLGFHLLIGDFSPSPILPGKILLVVIFLCGAIRGQGLQVLLGPLEESAA
jgi:hypothetical protein